MKNFDIEQLKRKNIYQTPEHFFEGMQQRVLEQTTQKKKQETKVFTLRKNWAYSLAAAVVVLFGIGIFINYNNSEPQPQTEFANQLSQETNPSENEILVTPEASSEVEKIETKLAVAELGNAKEKPQTEIANKPKNEVYKAVIPNAKKTQPEVVELALASFTSAEIAEMARDAEMDVYLDLYN